MQNPQPISEPHGRKRPERISLQIYLGIAFSVLFLILALVLAGTLDAFARREVLKLTHQNLENVTRQMARELSAGMNEFGKEVQAQALSHKLRDPNASAAEMREVLDGFVAIHPEFAFIGVIDIASAKVIAANGGIFEGGSAKGRPAFEEAKTSLFLGDVHDAVRLAELVPKSPNGEPARFLDASTPINDPEGKPFRVLAGHISFHWTDQVRNTVLAPLRASRGIEMLLLDTKGKVVLAPNDQIKTGTAIRSLLPTEMGTSTTTQTWAGGQQYLTVSAPVIPRRGFEGFGWQVVARQPVAVALEPTVALRNSFFAGAVVLGAFASLIAWFIARRITEPVRRLAESAKDLARGARLSDTERSTIGEVASVQDAIVGLADEGRRHASASWDQKQQFMTFAEFLPHLVFQADAEGTMEYVNKRWLAELDCAPTCGIGTLTDCMDERDQQGFIAQWQTSREQGIGFETILRLRTKTDFVCEWFKIRTQPVLDESGKLLRWVGTLTNIHQAMLQAERVEAALEQERAMRAETERVSRMKDNFLATLSHELRTPLNVIGGWAQMLDMRSGEDRRVKQAAEIITRNVEIQTNLISDLLDMSAVIAGKVVLDTRVIDGVRLLQQIIEPMIHLAHAKDVALHLAVPSQQILIEADARRMSQIVSNLVSNAIKFTDAGGHIDVRVTAAHGRFEFSVSDNGCGISKEFLPFVFDRFQQQDSSTTRAKGGIGLGLAIVRSLVELHQGTIAVRSDGIGKGCLFTVNLPALSATSLAVPEDDRQPESPIAKINLKLADVRLLVVDDEADARAMMVEVLQLAGAEVRAAQSAPDALKMLEEKRFDAIICDVGMPGMDGHTFIQRVRSNPDKAIAGLPAIALTAFAMQHDLNAAREAGFQRHIAKPFSVAGLIRAVQTLVGNMEETSS
ncbi:MAG TPA: ATP-binding protein [Noviherbaspirillum sp.]|uniref:ATP-binding protein n=1 Tax=Noviherbaspirillum sp. TaxID=1926288 RepID=UPI002DDD27AA|nr:ATP-binding protein [Noviherbaspirillum sp.]HEV2612008.1 ATP-binding protein [Noviherbaspirillum sp.]